MAKMTRTVTRMLPYTTVTPFVLGAKSETRDCFTPPACHSNTFQGISDTPLRVDFVT